MRSRLITAAVAVLCAFAANADESETITVTNWDPYPAHWADGTLSTRLINPRGEKKTVSLQFQFSEITHVSRKLKYLLVSLPNRRIDIRPFVSEEATLFPTRAIILIPSWTDTGEIEDLHIEVPYSLDHPERCGLLKVNLNQKGVIDRSTTETTLDRCSP
jgi:hypothetical protein